MNYPELDNLALENAIGHHISNLDELLAMGNTLPEIMQMIEDNHEDIIISERFEFHRGEEVISEIRSMHRSELSDYKYVLKAVMGEDAYENWEKGTK